MITRWIGSSTYYKIFVIFRPNYERGTITINSLTSKNPFKINYTKLKLKFFLKSNFHPIYKGIKTNLTLG